MLQNSPLDGIGQLVMLCVLMLLVAAARTDFVIRRDIHRFRPTAAVPPRFGERGAYLLPIPLPHRIWHLHLRLLALGALMFALAAIAALRAAKSVHDVTFGWMCVLGCVVLLAAIAIDWWRYVHRGRVIDERDAAAKRDASRPD